MWGIEQQRFSYASVSAVGRRNTLCILAHKGQHKKEDRASGASNKAALLSLPRLVFCDKREREEKSVRFLTDISSICREGHTKGCFLQR